MLTISGRSKGRVNGNNVSNDPFRIIQVGGLNLTRIYHKGLIKPWALTARFIKEG